MTTDIRLTSYCFLAALTENNNDLYNHVYVPICKRTLSLYSLKGHTAGKASDIQDLIREEYGLNVPVVIVRRLISSVLDSLSKEQTARYNAKVFEHGDSFQLSDYSFMDLESKYKKGQRDVEKLQLSYLNYLRQEQIEDSETLQFADFLDKNKRQVASFFRSGSNIEKNEIDESYLPHVQFLEYLNACDDELFRIAEQLYLGTIVASFLESEISLDATFEPNEVYYLDTPIILRSLDLQKEEDTKPALELLQLIRNTGGTIKVLSVTLDEIADIISTAIDTYDSKTPVTTVNEACIRLGKSKSWLIGIQAKIEEHILKTLNVEKESIPEHLLAKYAKNPDVEALQETRKKKGNALHDVAAYMYVRDKRKGYISSYQKGQYWFFSSNRDLLQFNKQRTPASKIAEIAMPDALTSLLWLKDPAKLSDTIKKVGLRELMATTLHEEIASKELIAEFATSISSIEDITAEDYQILLSSVAHQSAKRIAEISDLAIRDKSLAAQAAIDIVEKEKARISEHAKMIKKAQDGRRQVEKENSELTDRLKSLEDENTRSKKEHEQTRTELEKLSAQLESVQKRQKTNRRIVIWMIVCIASTAIVILLYKYWSSIWSRIISVIASLGGLWGFISMIINIIKSISLKK